MCLQVVVILIFWSVVWNVIVGQDDIRRVGTAPKLQFRHDYEQ